MNKDVIYIEPEDDITDILANIKAMKHKIVALVPPKKAGVLRSAVNFKLIAKTATQQGKTVVLITSDAALLRLASSVKMPTAKTLQSKPHLPELDDAEEFGDNDGDEKEEAVKSGVADVVDDEVSDHDDDAVERVEAKTTAKKAKNSATEDSEGDKSATHAVVAVSRKAAKTDDIDMEIDGKNTDDENDDDSKTKKKAAKKPVKVPNFKKFRVPIIIGVLVILALVGVGYWAFNIAPAAKIVVKVKTTTSNFNETVTLVTDQTKSDPEKGILYAEQKTVTKQATDDFEATGEVDKGTKATGTITVTRAAGDRVGDNNGLTFTVPKGTSIKISGKEFEVSDGGTIYSVKTTCGTESFEPYSCTAEAKSITLNIVAKEVGESYNLNAATSGVELDIKTDKKYTISSSATTGGTTKIVKIVSSDDVDKASLGLSNDIDNEAREELTREFSSEYILISSSFSTESSKVTTSPALNEEVSEGVTPKILKENKYVIYAVDKKEIDTYIQTVVASKLGDDTQIVYSTGVAMTDNEDNKAFFEAFKNENGTLTAKLKSTAKTGPRITEDMVKEVALGEKVGRVQSNLRSYKGVSEAHVYTSYFWVTSVPEDENKVQIEITVE